MKTTLVATFAAKVAVIPELELSVIAVVGVGQGLVVPPQLVVFRSPAWPLQPEKTEPASATAEMR